MKKYCLACGISIEGRIDKKYCSDYCRSSYHNDRNNPKNKYMRKVNYILRKNRRILAKLNPEGKNRVHKEKLKKAGFDFNYTTNVYRTRKGYTYFFCYEQGYLPLTNNFVALVINQEYKEMVNNGC